MQTTASVAAVERASGLAQEVSGWAEDTRAGDDERYVQGRLRCGQAGWGGSTLGGGGGRSEAAADGSRGRGEGEWRRRRPCGVCDWAEEAGKGAGGISKERVEGAGFVGGGWGALCP